MLTSNEYLLGRTATDVLERLKAVARKLHKQIRAADPQAANSPAIARARVVREFATSTDEELVAGLQRRHCLNVIAAELGFRVWAELAHALEGGTCKQSYGTLLCPGRMMAHQNIWLADYEEAVRIREEHGGFLLGYRKQYFIADRDYVHELGLDPECEDWARMQNNWIEPKDNNARARLYARLCAERLPA